MAYLERIFETADEAVSIPNALTFTKGITIAAGSATIASGLSLSGTITSTFTFGSDGAGIVHGGAAAAAVAGYVKIAVGSTAYRIPYLADSDT